jgi:hypothetical protein
VISDESDRFNPRDPKPADAGKPSKSEKRREARQLATQALYQCHMAGTSLNEIEAQFRVDNDFTDADAAVLPRHPARRACAQRPRSMRPWHLAWTSPSKSWTRLNCA